MAHGDSTTILGIKMDADGKLLSNTNKLGTTKCSILMAEFFFAKIKCRHHLSCPRIFEALSALYLFLIVTSVTPAASARSL